MSKPETKKKRKKFAVEEAAIREIINAWKPIGCSTPEDEYDCLVHHLISLLHLGGNRKDIFVKIRYELENHFGITPPSRKEITAVADKIYVCWQKVKIGK